MSRASLWILCPARRRCTIASSLLLEQRWHEEAAAPVQPHPHTLGLRRPKRPPQSGRHQFTHQTPPLEQCPRRRRAKPKKRVAHATASWVPCTLRVAGGELPRPFRWGITITYVQLVPQTSLAAWVSPPEPSSSPMAADHLNAAALGRSQLELRRPTG
jgi:hypothetical protein